MLRRVNSSPAFHRYSRIAHSSPEYHRVPAELLRDGHMETATAKPLAASEHASRLRVILPPDCLLEDGQLSDGLAYVSTTQTIEHRDSSPMIRPGPRREGYVSTTSRKAPSPTKCARSTALAVSLRGARRLAFTVPIAAAAISYLLVLDVANRSTTKPPFWGAAELQAQFMGLGIGEEPCRPPPPSPPARPPPPPAPPPPPRAPALAEVMCVGWWCGSQPAVAWPTPYCGSRRNRPEQWLFKYAMWSWLFVIEACQGHATVLLVLLQALLEFSFTMDAGRNNNADKYWFCCSSYAYFFFLPAGLIAAIDVALRRRRRRKGRGLGLPFSLLVGWLTSALGTLSFDSWQHNHHFLAFLMGTLCALLNMLVVREREAWGSELRARVEQRHELKVEPEEEEEEARRARG